MSVFAGVTYNWLNGTPNGRSHAARKVISQTGLICNVDASAFECYPGSGSTWTDLTGSGITGSMTSPVTWSDTYWSGFDDNTVFGLSLNMNSGGAATAFSHGTGDFTYSFWLYFNTLSISFQGIFNMGAGVNSLIRLRTATQIDIIGGITGSTQQISPTVSTISINTWTNITFVRSSGSMTVYVNGTPNTPTSFTPNYSFATSDAGIFGHPNFIGQKLDGRFATFHAYSRALSATEVTSNFNILRGRFGV